MTFAVMPLCSLELFDCLEALPVTGREEKKHTRGLDGKGLYTRPQVL